MYIGIFIESQFTNIGNEAKKGIVDTTTEGTKLNGKSEIQSMDCIKGKKAI